MINLRRAMQFYSFTLGFMYGTSKNMDMCMFLPHKNKMPITELLNDLSSVLPPILELVNHMFW